MSNKQDVPGTWEDLDEDQRRALLQLADEHDSDEHDSDERVSRREFGKAGLLTALGLGTGAGVGGQRAIEEFVDVGRAQSGGGGALGNVAEISGPIAGGGTVSDLAGSGLDISNGALTASGAAGIFEDSDGDGVYEQSEGDGIETPSVSTDRILTSSRAAEVVVWTDGSTVYADGPGASIDSGSDANAVLDSVLQNAADVFIAPGTYSFGASQSNAPHPTSDTTIRGVPGASVLDMTGDYGFVLDGVDNVTVSGLSFTGTGTDPISMPSDAAKSGNISVERCTWDGDFRACVWGNAGADGLRYANNWVLSNTGGYGLHAAGASTEVEIFGNSVRNTYWNGISVYGNTDGFSVVGNTCYNTGHASIAVDPAKNGVVVGNVANTLNPNSDNPDFEGAIQVKSASAHGGGQTENVVVGMNYCTGFDAGLEVRRDLQGTYDPPHNVTLMANLSINNENGIMVDGACTEIRDDRNVYANNTTRFSYDSAAEIYTNGHIRDSAGAGNAPSGHMIGDFAINTDDDPNTLWAKGKNGQWFQIGTQN